MSALSVRGCVSVDDESLSTRHWRRIACLQPCQQHSSFVRVAIGSDHGVLRGRPGKDKEVEEIFEKK